jgi:hypothetical protein
MSGMGTGIHRGLFLAALVLAAVAAPAETPTYADVSSRYRAGDYITDADIVVRIEAEAIVRQGGGRAPVLAIDGVRAVCWSGRGHWMEWTLTVPRRGLYTIEARCEVPEIIPTEPWSIQRAVSIDGQLPFREMQDFYFMDAWIYSQEERDWRIRSLNEYGEKPDVALRETVPSRIWQTALLVDRETASVEPYLFLLEAGTHTLRMEALNRPGMNVDAFTVRSYRPLRPYTEVSAEYQRKGYAPTSGVTVKIQAEQYLYQDRNMTPRGIGGVFDDAAVLLMRNNGEPQGDYNTMAIWRRFNHSVFWAFDVPETGLYKMVIRYTQNQDSEMHREIRIDGKVPFRELSPYLMRGTGGRLNTPPRILYDIAVANMEGVYDVVAWKQGIVGTDPGFDAKRAPVEPYLFYLEKGSHLLQMRPVLGPERVKIKRDIEAVRNAVSGPFQQVKELLGQYASLEEAVTAKLDLRAQLPGLSTAYANAAKDLDVIMAEIMALVPPGRAAEAMPTISVLKIVQQEVEAAARDPNVLLAPEQFDSGFSTGSQGSTSITSELQMSNQGNFEARVVNRLSYTALLYDSQAVEIDWIAFTSPEVRLTEPAAPWFYTIRWVWKEFLRSFTQ